MRRPGMRGGFSPGRCGELTHAAPIPASSVPGGLDHPQGQSPEVSPWPPFPGQLEGPSSVRSPRDGLRGSSGSRRPNAPGLDVCAHGGVGVSPGECVCVQRKGRLVKTLFPPFIFFFSSLFCFSEEAAAGLPGMNEISFQGFSRVTFTLSV